MVGILFLAFRRRHDLQSLLRYAVWAWAIYLFLATTVHPWYVIPMVGVATLSGQIWPVVWSGLIVLSYSHYQGGGFEENYLIITLEYLLLLAAILWEARANRLKGQVGSA